MGYLLAVADPHGKHQKTAAEARRFARGSL